MTIIVPPRAAWLVLVLLVALVLAPAALADERDPRCADWERNGAPPGTDMAVMCPSVGPTEATVDLDSEPLFPYLVALVVIAVVLVAFGIVAMRWTAQPARPRPSATAYWSCTTCGTMNPPARTACFACQAPMHPA